MAAGFLDEVRALLERPRALSRSASQALGYKELLGHLTGQATVEDALALAIQRTRRFARRQERWFRRDPRVTWLTASENSVEVADAVLRDWPRCN
jgi:tRNA dimethylallyltransferase